ncbi:hypothetical protein [Pseudoalteromonas ardens]|uniref:Uncharacterized protein n=1 Tax=Pseudoalteromonas rubra TaxID=43658 RepID=A0A0L0ESV4_9GAMM|nr:hypothetical protein [Pseudoalteromonas sp. R96]KNC67494.1 hypothetical protein AC626_10470 [Pseudoalteromonas rubra]MDK1310629.1 hypothetical protein [Pseudoalteromonas sp. R96]
MKQNYKLALCVAAGLAAQSANAGETTLKLTKPSGNPNSPQKVRTVNLGSVADSLFSDMRQLELETEADIRRDLNNMSAVKYIYSVDLDAKNISATFTGTDNYKIRLTVGNLGFYTKVKFDGVGVFCPSVKVAVRLENLRPTVTYNYYTGALENIDVSYGRDVDVSCSGGILSLPGVSQFVNYFASNYATAKADDLIKANLRQFASLERPGALFGMQEILADSRVRGNVDAAERYLGIDINNIIGNLVTGMNLNVSLNRDANGYNKHQAHIGVYQSAPTITPSWGGQFNASAPGANRISKYALSGTWSSSSWTPGVLYNNQFIGAIAYNRVYGVPSYLAQKQVTIGNCGKACE